MRLLACIPFAIVLSAAAAVAQAPVRVLTFNIRYGTANDGAHRWPNRSAHVIATIRDHAPHILGIQEALRGQLDEIARALPAYRELGVGRDDGKTAGEYAALLIDTTRFGIVTSGHFWYSDTPDVPGSKHWGNNVTRICTWARMVDRTTGDTLRVYNSHWDHESQPSREKSAALLLARIGKDGNPRDRLLVLADFNSDEENAAFHTLLADPRANLHDTFRERHADALNVGTFHGFKGDSSGGKIDAILAGSGWVAVDASIDRRKFGELWASDHFAVSASLRTVPVVSGLATFEPAADERYPEGASTVHAFSDFDNDGDVDAFIFQAGNASRLFERRGSTLPEVARYRLPSLAITTAAWGNITRPEFPPLDRFSDLAVGLVGGGIKLFHNRGADPRADPELRWSGLEDITKLAGLDTVTGKVRTLKWLDFDGDFDIDLFIAFYDRAPALYAAKMVSGVTGSVRFENATLGAGLLRAKPMTGAIWIDYDMDGDLDLIAGGTAGEANVVYLNTKGTFAEVGRNTAIEWGRMEGNEKEMNTSICGGDVNGDGLLDLFFSNHGRNALILGRGPASHENATAAWNLTQPGFYDGCAFGDFDNDGRLDLFLNGSRASGAPPQAILLRNTGDRFVEVTPTTLAALRDVHGGRWVDLDRDGDLDLAMTGTARALFENQLDSAAAGRSLTVRVRDIQDFMTLTGAEIRVYNSNGDKRLLAMRIVDDGAGGGSQSDMPVHFGLPNVEDVDVEVTYPKGDRRIQLRIEAISIAAYRGRALTLRLPPEVRR